ncbi:hypothetical protein IJH23_01890 [Candidatus Saccharibacteria bacterium]|nr:hypothetical protein [Candidatus Saccharibacteria bacterium]
MVKKSTSRAGSKQGTLFGTEKSNREPASELMKIVAEKVPSRKKILKDFAPEEARMILSKLEQNKNENEKMETGADKGKSEWGEEKERESLRKDRIREVKRIAKEMEIGNRSKLILFPSYSRNRDQVEWYKMGNFSALYYVYRMADRMGKTPKIQRDNDRFSKMHGIVCINGIEKFLERTMKLNEFEKYEKTLDGLYIVYMKQALSDADLALLRKTGELQKEAMHNVLRPKKASPELYLTILMLGRQIMRIVEKMDIVYRSSIGDTIYRTVLELMEVYFLFMDKKIDIEKAKDDMIRKLFRIRAGMTLLGEDEIASAVKICAVGETIVKIEILVNGLR